MKKLAKSFFIYAFCGAIATAVDWGTFYAMSTVLAWHYMLAVGFSFTLGSITNFSLNKVITFKNKYKNVMKQYLLHLCVSIVSLMITMLIMYVLIERAGLAKFNARMLTTAIVLFINFFLHKNITFGMLK